MAENSVRARILMQQCISAKMKIEREGRTLEIGRGVVIFICFLHGADIDLVNKIVTTVLNVKLSESDDEKRTSILDLPGSVLVIPQATLGGKLKGKVMQYHRNVDKSLGEELFNYFVESCKKGISQNPKVTNDIKVESGIYGERQVLSMETNGPYSHLIEL